LIAWIAGAASNGRSDEIPFVKHTIDLGANEACTWADVNGDGRLDIVSGENWFEAPKWVKHKFRISIFRTTTSTTSATCADVDGDGRIDIVSVSWFSKKWRGGATLVHLATLERNGDREHLPDRIRLLVDLDNDGKASNSCRSSATRNSPRLV